MQKNNNIFPEKCAMFVLTAATFVSMPFCFSLLLMMMMSFVLLVCFVPSRETNDWNDERI